jgi:hypothetical protein
MEFPYYLRTSTTKDFKGYPSLAEARLALDNLINAKSIDATSVTEEPDGKWVIRHGSEGGVKVWIESDKLEVMPLNEPTEMKLK